MLEGVAYIRPLYRTEQMLIRLTPDERKAMREAATREGLTLSEFVRNSAMARVRGDDEFVRGIIHEALAEVLMK